MKKTSLISIALSALMLTSCTAGNTESTGGNSVAESTVTANSEDFFESNIKSAIEKKKTELDLSDAPFGVTNIYSGTMFDYNGDGYKDYITAYGLYAQFELVIIDSQSADILFEERIMMNVSGSTNTEIYLNGNSEYAFKISERIAKPIASDIVETIQIITASEECVLEAVYDLETEDFIHAYNEYTQDEYIHKQQDLLNGYEHFADIEWTEILSETTAESTVS